MTGAAFHNGTSKQDYATPRDFYEAVCRKFGRPTFDLAANGINTKCDRAFFGELDDSLKQDWLSLEHGLLWLNPPYSNIRPWAEKCAITTNRANSRKRILFLVPASVGSEWFADYVKPHSDVYFLRPRLSFDGKNPYPKDVMLCHFYGQLYPDIELWKWR